MRLAFLLTGVAVVGAVGCHGAQIQEADGGTPGAGGHAGTTGAAGNGGSGGGGASGSGGGGASGSGGGGAGQLPKTLAVVSGTGSPGVAYTRMTALEGNTAYPVVLDIYDGNNALAPLIVTRAVQLSTGAPTTLSMSDEAISDIYDGKSAVTIDATYVYWFSRTIGDAYQLFRMRRAPKLGGPREDVMAIDDSSASAPNKPLVMATGGGYVYWAAYGNGIYRCKAVAGCDTGPTQVVPTTEQVQTIVVRGDWLYWASAETGKVWRHGLTTPGDVMLDGGPTLGLGQTCDIAVSADDTELWSIQCLYPYQLRRVNVTVMSGTTIANLPNETADDNAVGSLALGTDTVYFIGSDHVFSVPRTMNAATPQMLANLMTPSGVVADGIIGIDDQAVTFSGTKSSTGGNPNASAGYVLRMAR
jgi:hypothetical protein